MVLLKSWGEDGFVFYTNYDGRKGHELSANPQAALLFYWEPLGRQVRIEGTVGPDRRGRVRRLLRHPAPWRQIGAYASHQSELDRRAGHCSTPGGPTDGRVRGRRVPRPPWWGGCGSGPGSTSSGSTARTVCTTGSATTQRPAGGDRQAPALSPVRRARCSRSRRIAASMFSAMADDTTLVEERTDQLLDELDPTRPLRSRSSGAASSTSGWPGSPFPRAGAASACRPTCSGSSTAGWPRPGRPRPGAREFFGLTMAGPTVVTHGSDELRDRLLRRTFTGEESWCQLFSEPGSGSDLAGLATRAVRDGDEWVITGQKVWNTLAHIADRGMLVARTDPEAPKHKGLTYFALDMHAPGVEVRPLRQMTGEAEFNEVYMTEVRVPDADRIGDVGEGWRVAMTTLSNERTTIGGGGGPPTRGSGSIAEAVRIWRPSDGCRRSPVERDRLDAAVDRGRGAAADQHAGHPEPQGRQSRARRARSPSSCSPRSTSASTSCASTCWGPTALVGYDYTMRRSETLGLVGPPGSARKMFLRSRANSIEGGTSEIQRNILGERILGLPGDVRVDKELPWSKVPQD